jgi:WD40 repeat protein
MIPIKHVDFCTTRTHETHWEGVTAICVKNGIVVTGTRGGSVKVWIDMGDGGFDCIAFFIGHTEQISAVCIQDNLILSASHDSTIRVWRLDAYQPSIKSLEGKRSKWKNVFGSKKELPNGCIAVLQGHASAIASMRTVQGRAFSQSPRGVVNVWDLKTFERVHRSFSSHSIQESKLCANDRYIVSAGYRLHVWVFQEPWNMYLHSGKFFDTNFGTVTCACLHGDLIVGGLDDGRIRAWHLETAELMFEVRLKFFSSPLIAIQVTDHDIVAANAHSVSFIHDTDKYFVNHFTGYIKAVCMEGRRVYAGSDAGYVHVLKCHMSTREVMALCHGLWHCGVPLEIVLLIVELCGIGTLQQEKIVDRMKALKRCVLVPYDTRVKSTQKFG